jgi:hypothetical protein
MRAAPDLQELIEEAQVLDLKAELRALRHERDEALQELAAYRAITQMPANPPDRIALRKAILRRIWRNHYPGMPRSAAARAIEIEWKEHIPGTRDREPNALEAGLDDLARLLIRPLAWRQLADDLDASLD